MVLFYREAGLFTTKYSEKPEIEQIDIAFDIIESILEMVFETEEKRQKLMEYREMRR